MIAGMTRPQMPGRDNQRRSRHLADRLLVLESEHTEIAEDWVKGFIPEEVLETWGPLDLSINPLASICLQLSTPGLYGAHPTIDNADPSAIQVELELERSGYWAMMQRVEYYARGLGEVLIKIERVRDDRVSLRMVMPHDVWVEVDPDDPMTALLLGELRIRTNMATGEKEYTWDVYDIRDPESPRYAIHRAGQGGEIGEDVTAFYAPDADGEYPWRYPDGSAYIPYVCYHESWTGRYWNPGRMREIYHGTLNVIAYATFTAHAAHSASGSVIIIAGLEPLFSTTKTETRTGQPTRSLVTQPGMALYHEISGVAQPMVTEVGPGANLTMLWEFVGEYVNQMLVRMGLESPDGSRTASGLALSISNRSKREASARLAQSFRRSDIELLSKVGAVMRSIGTAPDAPVDGYSITYRHPPDSPQEEKERRDSIEWRVASGMMSRIDAYQELHPGTTRDAAIRALRQTAADQRAIDAETPMNGEPNGPDLPTL